MARMSGEGDHGVAPIEWWHHRHHAINSHQGGDGAVPGADIDLVPHGEIARHAPLQLEESALAKAIVAEWTLPWRAGRGA
jgi:hypothetical protein